MSRTFLGVRQLHTLQTSDGAAKKNKGGGGVRSYFTLALLWSIEIYTQGEKSESVGRTVERLGRER